MEQAKRRFVLEPCLAGGRRGRASVRGRLLRHGRRVTYCGSENCVGPKRCRACRRIYMRFWRKAGRESLGQRRKRRGRRAA